jgi:SanA protein
MLRKIILGLLRGLLVVFIFALVVFAIPRLVTQQSTQSRLYSVTSAPVMPVAIVFGAGLSRNGTPSAILRDRIETAVQLYQTGKVKKILMSGDNRFENYNEPGAMASYAIALNVPAEDIVLDYAGRRTYDTCYRARHIFGVKEAILVTQSFHMPRAMYICRQLELNAIGVPADIRHYLRRSYAYWNIREIPATSIALWEVWVTRPLPVLGKPEPIFGENNINDTVIKGGG